MYAIGGMSLVPMFDPMASVERLDVADLASVREAAARLAAQPIDVLVHNAGALTADRRTAPSGLELVVASQVVGPFLLTSLLLDRLRQHAPGRVITMSSGGMYASPLRVDDLQMGDDYKGSEFCSGLLFGISGSSLVLQLGREILQL